MGCNSSKSAEATTSSTDSDVQQNGAQRDVNSEPAAQPTSGQPEQTEQTKTENQQNNTEQITESQEQKPEENAESGQNTEQTEQAAE